MKGKLDRKGEYLCLLVLIQRSSVTTEGFILRFGLRKVVGV